jgi:uncharacterized membrane protein
MNKSIIFAAFTAALALVSATSFANKNNDAMEKCMINKDGKGLIKKHKADCSSAHSSCAGQNDASDPKAWIFVPKGECIKINAGDYSSLSPELKAKIERTN